MASIAPPSGNGGAGLALALQGLNPLLGPSTAGQVPGSPSGPAAVTPPPAAPQGQGGGLDPATTQFAPVLRLAQQLAQAKLQPQLQSVQEQQAAGDASARANESTIAGYMRALAPILSGIAPSVQQGYRQAANEDATMAQAFGNQLGTQQGAANNEANNILNISGGQAQQPEVSQAIGGPGVAGALGWLNGGLPAAGLQQAGAAFGAAAKALPAEEAGMGQQQIGSLQAKQQMADQAFAQKLQDINARYPGYLDQSIQSIERTNKPTIFGSAQEGRFMYDPLTGKITKVTTAAPTPPKVFGDSKSGYYTINDKGQTVQMVAPVAAPFKATVNVAASQSSGVLTYVGSDGQLHAFTDAKGNTIPYRSAYSIDHPFIPKFDKNLSAQTHQLSYIGQDGQIHAFADVHGNAITYSDPSSIKTFSQNGNEFAYNTQTHQLAQITNNTPTSDKPVKFSTGPGGTSIWDPKTGKITALSQPRFKTTTRSSSSKPAGLGGFTPYEIGRLVDGWAKGSETSTSTVHGKNAQGNSVSTTTPTYTSTYSYTDAVSALVDKGLTMAKAQRFVIANPKFRNQAISIAQQGAAASVAEHHTYDQALANARAIGLPDSITVPILKATYAKAAAQQRKADAAAAAAKKKQDAENARVAKQSAAAAAAWQKQGPGSQVATPGFVNAGVSDTSGGQNGGSISG